MAVPPPNDRSRLEDIFDQVVDLPPGDRAAFLDAHCGDDTDLRARIEQLLAADERQTQGFLTPPFRTATESGEQPEIGTVIDGRYTLKSVLGEGGMGIVFLAEQTEPVRREVALKLIKLGMDTREVVARFETERQALALMNHPNIARVLDAGATGDGRPYFVMEHVPGVRITEDCDRHHLTVSERLDLFVQVCEAIHHAHQNGVIHRDIKPSNVLVDRQGGTPVPKVIDFGVAKATSHRLTEKTLFTEHGQLIGTPEYMSPEQAAMTGDDVDTRSDVYSLGVLLYELLAGLPPFDPAELRRAGFDEILRCIREEQPARPSTRLSSLGADRSRTVAAGRQTATASIVREMRGDLDWITMKAIEKDRTRRYDSVAALASDIRRHLRNEPVEAGPPSAAYQISKFARRHRVLVASVLAFAFVLITATLVSIAFGVIATTARDDAIAAQEEQQRQTVIAQRQTAIAERQAYIANLAAADSALRADELPAALAHLDAVPEAMRDGFEWQHLRGRMDDSVAVFRRDGDEAPAPKASPGSQGELLAYGLAFSPDGTLLAGGGRDKILTLRDATSGEIVRTMTGHEGTIWSVAFHPDGTRVASSSGDHTVRVWDVATGEAILTMTDPDTEVATIAWSHRGDLIASAAGNGTIRLWDGSTGEQRRVLTGHAEPIWSLAWSQADDRLASGCEDGTARIWDPRPEGPDEALHVIEGPWSRVDGVAFSHDGTMLATGLEDKSLRVWDTTDYREVRAFRGHESRIGRVRFTRDDTRLVTGSSDATVRMWDLESGRELATMHGHRSVIWPLAMSSDGSRVATAAFDGTIRLWDTAIADEVNALRGHVGIVWSIAFSADGSRLVTAGHDGTVRLWDVASGMHYATFTGHDGRATAVAWLDDLVVSAGQDATVRVWSARTGVPRAMLQGHDGPVLALAISPDGAMIASGGDDGTIRLWDTTSFEEIAVLEGHTARVVNLAFSPDGSTLASGSHDKTARLWDVAARSPGHVLEGHEWLVYAVRFSPDGSWLATASIDRTARRWNTADGTPIGEPLVHASPVFALAVDPAGTRIATTTNEGAIVLWSAATGEELLALRGHVGGVPAIAFSPDGRRIVSGATAEARIWDADPIAVRLEARVARTDHTPAATATVTALFDRLGDPDQVVEAIEADQGLSPAARRLALQIAVQETVRRGYGRTEPDLERPGADGERDQPANPPGG